MKKTLQVLGIIALVFVITAAVVTIIHFAKPDEVKLPVSTASASNVSKTTPSESPDAADSTVDLRSIYIPFYKEYCIQNAIPVTNQQLRREPSEYANKLVTIEGTVELDVFASSRMNSLKYIYFFSPANFVYGKDSQMRIVYNYDSLKSPIIHVNDDIRIYGKFLGLGSDMSTANILVYYVDFID